MLRCYPSVVPFWIHLGVMYNPLGCNDQVHGLLYRLQSALEKAPRRGIAGEALTIRQLPSSADFHRLVADVKIWVAAAAGCDALAPIVGLTVQNERPAIVTPSYCGSAAQLAALHSDGLPLQVALEVGAATARGLAALHAAGSAHGGLKPEHILLGRGGRHALVMAADADADAGAVGAAPATQASSVDELASAIMGISLSATASASSGARTSARASGSGSAAQPAGTAARGRDAASDVFALGRVICHLLTGAAPASDAYYPPPAPAAAATAIAAASTHLPEALPPRHQPPQPASAEYSALLLLLQQSISSTAQELCSQRSADPTTPAMPLPSALDDGAAPKDVPQPLPSQLFPLPSDRFPAQLCRLVDAMAAAAAEQRPTAAQAAKQLQQMAAARLSPTVDAKHVR